jgi:hypothetical protein
MKKTTLIFVIFALHASLFAQSSWQMLTPPVYSWNQVAVASPNVLYAVNDLWGNDLSTLMIRSADAGATWDSVNTFYLKPYGLEFWDAENGHLLGGMPSCGLFAGMINVTNGGQNLVYRDYFNESYSIATSNLQTQSGSFNDFYLASMSSFVYHTSDTGATLQKVLTVADEWTSLNDVHFATESKGYACGLRSEYNPFSNDFTNVGYLYHTNDGGTTWEADSFANTKFDFLAFASAQYGFALGGKQLAKTTNGGQDWLLTTLPFVATNFQLLDPAHLICIDTAGDVWETLDAGNTWLASLMDKKIRDIQCGHNTCLVGGDNGSMYKTPYYIDNSLLSGTEDFNISYTITPNPAFQKVQFKTSSSASFDYTIIDMTGRILLRGQVQYGVEIDITELPSAAYTFSVHGVGAKVFLVQH